MCLLVFLWDCLFESWTSLKWYFPSWWWALFPSKYIRPKITYSGPYTTPLLVINMGVPLSSKEIFKYFDFFSESKTALVEECIFIVGEKRHKMTSPSPPKKYSKILWASIGWGCWGLDQGHLLYQLPSPTNLVCVKYHELDGGLLVPEISRSMKPLVHSPALPSPQIGKKEFFLRVNCTVLEHICHRSWWDFQ